MEKCFWFAVEERNLLGYVWELSKMIFDYREINNICLRLHVLRKPVLAAHTYEDALFDAGLKKWKSVSPAGLF